MSDNDNVNDDTTNVTDDDNDNSQDDSVADTDDVETLKAQIAEKDKQNVKLFERAKKAEGFEKQPDGSWVKVQKKPEVKPEPKPTEVAKTEVGLTPMDAILLSKANITEADDIEELVKYANFKGITVKDALKDKTAQTILRDRAEMRQTAEATNTGNARRGSSKVSDEQILADVNEGKFPTDPEALAVARHKAKFKK